MRRTILAMAAGLALVAVGALSASAAPADIARALSDPSRPAKDRELDAQRKAAEVVAFSGLKPGDKVADVFPGSGYYTRIFAKVVGPKGRVYSVVPTEAAAKPYKPLEPIKALAAEPAYANVEPLVQPMKAFDPPAKLDVVFISQFYHDMHNADYGGPDIVPVNASVFKALKPGGVYLIIDHSAPGTGLSATSTLHRIDEAAVKKEVEAAGFVLEGESDVLHNPADPHTANVFNPSIRGHTDQFMLKFRKPK
jgi:predicted methyltransferase